MEDHWSPRYWNENFVTATSALRNWVNWAATSCKDEGGKMGRVRFFQSLAQFLGLIPFVADYNELALSEKGRLTLAQEAHRFFAHYYEGKI
jgi:hypothetical protein